MKFKIDENLPLEYRPILEQAGFHADTVADENLSGQDDSIVIARCRSESRILITLDLDFGNIHSYPPQSYSGIIVFRSKSQDKLTLIGLLRRLVSALQKRSPERQLWIVERDRIRVRE